MEFSTLRLLEVEDGIVEVCFVRKDGRPNFVSQELLTDLSDAAEQLHEISQNIRGVLMTAQGPTWMGTLSVDECRRLQQLSEEDLRRWAEDANRTLNYFQDLERPTVAVLHAPALGCGLDLALTADARVASAQIALGFTEKEYGFMPALLGPWRLAGIAGLAHAFDWACTGIAYPATRAKALGVLDAVVNGELRSAALQVLAALCQGSAHSTLRERVINRTPKDGPPNDNPPDIAAQARTAREALAKSGDGYLPSTNETIAALEETVRIKRDRAGAPWAARFARVTRSTATDSVLSLVPEHDAAHGLAARIQRRVPDLSPYAVLGGGKVVGALAADLTAYGVVRAFSPHGEGLEEARIEFEGRLQQRLVRRQLRAETATECTERYVEVTDPALLNDCRVVVDARPATAPPQPVGPSLWFGDMPDAAVFEQPGPLAQMAGITLMPLEWRSKLALVTYGKHSSTSATQVALSMAHRMGLVAIPVQPTAAGLVHRILFAGVMGYCDLIHHGVAFARADMLLRNDGWARGIGQLLDSIPPDVVRYRLALLQRAFPERFKVGFQTAVDIVLDKRRRFYQPDGEADETTQKILKNARVGTVDDFSSRDVLAHIINPMVLESIRCLEEKVAVRAGVVNLVMVMSKIFPLHRGGPMKRLEASGHQALIAWATKNSGMGEMVRVPDSLREHLRNRSNYA